MLGKRKARDDNDGDRLASQQEDDIRAKFRQAFNARFKPLQSNDRPSSKTSTTLKDEALSESSASEWDGLSDQDEDTIEIIDHVTAPTASVDVLSHERKAFMSAVPPLQVGPNQIRTKDEGPAHDDALEASNLKQDLALQRLLKESHLLDPSAFSSGPSTVPQGSARLKAIDLRIQDLGGKKSLQQQKMPLAMRRGILAKTVRREDKRRKDAADNGIILERVKSTPKTEHRRERSVGGPGVGSFRGGTLRLSSKDIRSIEGPKRAYAGRNKGKRR